ncbi:sperm-associated antigen 8 [Leuresthes tenuis]|uniref:sperm-associated antigen 8 n=1 Tax=Leuresthes tenuis TaxID=355514 RepID=UPI003B50B727
MTEQSATLKRKAGGILQYNWTEERAVAAHDAGDPKWIQKHGHKGILTTDFESPMESMTTSKASHVTPVGPRVRVRGIRRELLERHIAQIISEKVSNDLQPLTPRTDYSSTTQRDFCVEGFVPCRPQTTKVHDYKTDQAITFWSENYQRVQGVTPAQTLEAPFRKSALFSTPISERLDEIELPPDN